MIDPSKLEAYRKEAEQARKERKSREDAPPTAADGIYKFRVIEVVVSREKSKYENKPDWIKVKSRVEVVEPAAHAKEQKSLTLPMFLKVEVANFLISSGRESFNEESLDDTTKAFDGAEFVAKVAKGEKFNHWEFLPPGTKATGPFEAVEGTPF